MDPITLTGLVKDFGSVRAVDDLTFTVAPGRITGFLGPNGAGKTTTLRLLLGLLEPTSGTATFGDARYVDWDQPQRFVGSVLEASFHPGRSGRNHLRVLAPTAGASDSRVDELLDLVGLTQAAKRPVGGYSLGMRQRLALAAALLGDPKYLVLDEPANGLDPEGIRWLRTFLQRFAASGRTVLMSSHLLSEVAATADDIVVIKNGRLLVQSKMADLNFASGASRVRAFDLPQALQVLRDDGFEVEPVADDQGDYLRVLSPDTDAIGLLLFDQGLAVRELARERFDLEERFFAMLEEAS